MFSRPLLRHVIMTLILFAFIMGSANAQQPRYGGALMFGTMGQPLNLDPGVINDTESEQVASQIFETLVRYDSINNRYLPVLATGWQATGDKKVWTFNLRRNVVFHDGSPFNANSVKFSWERQQNIRHKYHLPPYGRFTFYRAAWGGYPGNIKRIDVINDYTIQVTLYSRGTNFLKVISRLPFAIVSPRAVISKGAAFTKNPVGTGPFIFNEWRDWMRIDLKANTKYWGGRPYLDHVIFEPFPGEATRYRLVKRGWVDIMENPLPKLVREINRGMLKNYKLMEFPGTNYSYVSLNCKKPPLNDPQVRKALNFAINRPRILKKLDESNPLASSPIASFYGEGVSGRTYQYNLETARTLLKKAGYPNGFPLELWYIKIPRPYLISPERTAQEIVLDLRKIGVEVNLRGVKWEKFYEKLIFSDYQAALAGFPGIDYDPDLYFQLAWGRNNALLGGTNPTFYQNEKIMRYVDVIQASTDRSEKIRAAREIQEILSADCPMVPLFYNHTTLVVRKKVMGLTADKNGIIDFSGVWMTK